MSGPHTKPLGRGTRVRHAIDEHLVGSVTKSQAYGRRWVYYVRWDGHDHDSGQYGIRSLIRTRASR